MSKTTSKKTEPHKMAAEAKKVDEVAISNDSKYRSIFMHELESERVVISHDPKDGKVTIGYKYKEDDEDETADPKSLYVILLYYTIKYQNMGGLGYRDETEKKDKIQTPVDKYKDNKWSMSIMIPKEQLPKIKEKYPNLPAIQEKEFKNVQKLHELLVQYRIKNPKAASAAYVECKKKATEEMAMDITEKKVKFDKSAESQKAKDQYLRKLLNRKIATSTGSPLKMEEDGDMFMKFTSNVFFPMSEEDKTKLESGKLLLHKSVRDALKENPNNEIAKIVKFMFENGYTYSPANHHRGSKIFKLGETMITRGSIVGIKAKAHCYLFKTNFGLKFIATESSSFSHAKEEEGAHHNSFSNFADMAEDGIDRDDDDEKTPKKDEDDDDQDEKDTDFEFKKVKSSHPPKKTSNQEVGKKRTKDEDEEDRGKKKQKSKPDPPSNDEGDDNDDYEEDPKPAKKNKEKVKELTLMEKAKLAKEQREKKNAEIEKEQKKKDKKKKEKEEKEEEEEQKETDETTAEGGAVEEEEGMADGKGDNEDMMSIDENNKEGGEEEENVQDDE